MLTINNLSFKHHHNSPNILKAVSFGIEEGRMTTILGPNGSGKTTLFKCISGLWKPQEGSILFGDKDLTGLPWEERAGIIAVVPQEHEPPFPYSVASVVLMGRASHVSMFSSPSKHDHLKADEAIETIEIKHLQDRPYTELSGGERQLVLIARALAQEAPILILDEPTSHLDFRNQILILLKVQKLVKEKRLTVLMTLHDPNLAMQFSDNIVMINEGRIIAKGFPLDVLTKENLMNMYGIEVSIIDHNGTNIIYPKIAQ